MIIFQFSQTPNFIVQTILNKKSGLLFMSLGARLVNEESSECRILVAETLELLLSHINKPSRDELFDLTLVLLSDRKTSHREMGAQLCNRFIEVEKEEISKRLVKIIPAILKSLTNDEAGKPGMFVRAQQSEMVDSDDDDDAANDDDGYDSDSTKGLKQEQKQRAVDHQIIQSLNTLKKIFETAGDTLQKEKIFHEYIDELAYQLQKFLAYEHLWVRKQAANLLEHILSGIDYEKLQEILTNGINDTGRTYLYSNPKQEIKSLILDLCAQLIPGETEEEMVLQVTKNLLFLANAIQMVPIENTVATEEDNGNDSSKNVNLNWLIRRLRYAVHGEVTKTPKETMLVSKSHRLIHPKKMYI
jgi:U3 small nucleolar RNA-associated protein 20